MPKKILDIAGIIVSILPFLSGFSALSYKGLKNWKREGDDATHIKKWGKIDFFLGIGLSILAIVIVIILIWFLNLEDTTEDNKPESLQPPLSSVTSAESSISSTNNVYVSNELYQGATYTGYVNELRQPDGQGKMKYSDGSLYDGDWVDGIREGGGKMEYDNGVYDGPWKNDQKNGKGTYIWNDGKKYVGYYKDDIRCGIGTFTGWVDLTNGYVGTYVGESKNDMFEGDGDFFFDNGDKFEGIYKENLYWIGVYTRKDGSCYEVVNGKPKDEE